MRIRVSHNSWCIARRGSSGIYTTGNVESRRFSAKYPWTEGRRQRKMNGEREQNEKKLKPMVITSVVCGIRNEA